MCTTAYDKTKIIKSNLNILHNNRKMEQNRMHVKTKRKKIKRLGNIDEEKLFATFD